VGEKRQGLGAQEGRFIAALQKTFPQIEGESSECENLIGRFGLHRGPFSRSDKTAAALNNELQAGSMSQKRTR
jgi:hypothetical protein